VSSKEKILAGFMKSRGLNFEYIIPNLWRSHKPHGCLKRRAVSELKVIRTTLLSCVTLTAQEFCCYWIR